MPQSSDELRNKFGLDGAKAFVVIQNAGGVFAPHGNIEYDGNDSEVLEAIQFLCEEWDFSFI